MNNKKRFIEIFETVNKTKINESVKTKVNHDMLNLKNSLKNVFGVLYNDRFSRTTMMVNNSFKYQLKVDRKEVKDDNINDTRLNKDNGLSITFVVKYDDNGIVDSIIPLTAPSTNHFRKLRQYFEKNAVNVDNNSVLINVNQDRNFIDKFVNTYQMLMNTNNIVG